MLAREGGEGWEENVRISIETNRKGRADDGDGRICDKYTMKFHVPFLEMVGLEVAMPYGGQGGAS